MPSTPLIKLVGHNSSAATSHIITIVRALLICNYSEFRGTTDIRFSESNKGEAIIYLSHDESFPDASSIALLMQKMMEWTLDEIYAECTHIGTPSLIINKPTQAKMTLKKSCSRHIRAQMISIQNIDGPPTWLKIEATTGYAINVLIGAQSTPAPPEEVACLSITSRAKARTGEVYRLRTSNGKCSVVLQHSYCRLTLEPGMLIKTKRIAGQISRAVVSVVRLQPNLFDLAKEK